MNCLLVYLFYSTFFSVCNLYLQSIFIEFGGFELNNRNSFGINLAGGTKNWIKN